MPALAADVAHPCVFSDRDGSCCKYRKRLPWLFRDSPFPCGFCRTILHQYDPIIQTREGIIDIQEYPFALEAESFVKGIDGRILTKSPQGLKKKVKGFTLVDSIKTIKNISPVNYSHLYGWIPERALIFTGIQFGRSPMIAVRIHPVKPSVVVYHKPGGVDPLAIKLAERENIALVTTNISLDDLKERLVNLGKTEK